MIPENDNIALLLFSLSLDKPSEIEGYKSIRIDSMKRDREPYLLWYKEYEDLKISSLISRVQAELKKTDHSSQEAVALTILCIYSLIRKTKENAISTINSIFCEIVTGQLKQIHVLPQKWHGDFNLRLDSFQVGRINTERIEYRCKKIKRDSDFKEMEPLITNKSAIERDDYDIKVIDWLTVMEKNKTPFSLIIDHLIQEYFDYLSDYCFNAFWDLLKNEQIINLALGNFQIGDTDHMKSMEGVISISIFMNMGDSKKGYVLTLNRETGLAFDDVIRQEQYVKEKINIFEVNKYKNTELYSVFMNYAKFIASAKENINNKNINDGFLHFFIALELLFGQKNTVVAFILSKVSALTHLKFKRSFEGQSRILNSLYDKRSRYVHEGKAVNEEDADLLCLICEEVLFCLLQLFKIYNSSDEKFFTKWNSNIDYYISSIKADKIVAEDILNEIGIQKD